jgi:putative ABC transport system permease protein
MRYEIRDAVRTLARDGRFTSLAVSVLALTIGVTTAVYSLVHAIILRPLPFEDQDRVIVIWQRDLRRAQPVLEVAFGEMTKWRERTRTFADLAIVGSVNWTLTLEGPTDSQPLPYSPVSAAFLDVMGTRPEIGRGFNVSDEAGSIARTVIISQGLWERRFARAPAIVGRTLSVKLDPSAAPLPMEVVGVMPAGFDYPRGAELWLPAVPLIRGYAAATGEPPDRMLRWLRAFYVVGRLRTGVPLERARRELTEVMRTLDTESGPEQPEELVVTRIADYLVGPAGPVLWTLLAGATLMLIIAAVNVAGLQLSRAVPRQRVLAIRAALGASHRDLLRQASLESALLTAAAVVLSSVIAAITVNGLRALAPSEVPRLESVALVQPQVLGFGAVAAFLTLVVSGLWPAALASRIDAARVLAHAPGSGANRSGSRMQRVFVVAQVAVALTLLAGTALFLRTIRGLDRTVLGFDPEQLIAVPINPATDALEGWNAFYDAVIDRVEALPNIRAAAGVYLRPLSGPIGWDAQPIHFGQDPANPKSWGLNPMVNLEIVTPAYFEAMGIRLLRGRVFDGRDHETAPGVVIVSESAARRLWPGRDPLGQRLREGSYRVEDSPPTMKWQTVIGVVNDVLYRGLNDPRLDLYLPATQSKNKVQQLVVRTRDQRVDVAASVREIAREIDPNAMVGAPTLMTEVVAAESAPWRFLTRMFVAFAAVAGGLTIVGLGAVLALSVASRRRELAIRAALGAERRQLQAGVLREGSALVAVGCVFGLLGAVLLGRSTARLLVGVEPHDAFALSASLILAVAVGLLACWLPARRAADANPIEALRSE